MHTVKPDFKWTPNEYGIPFTLTIQIMVKHQMFLNVLLEALKNTAKKYTRLFKKIKIFEIMRKK